jgi:hypothetical protein
MSVLAVVGAKGAPGATTAVVAVALGWPGPVLVVDADPAGGDVVAGWLAARVGLDRGLLTFAAATRHLDPAAAAELGGELGGHVVGVPEAAGVRVLPGLGHAGQSAGLDAAGWYRLAAALAGLPWAVDVVVDCGRSAGGLPWPLLTAAEVVLLVTRPSLRGGHHARHAAAVLDAGLGNRSGLGLAVCGPGPYSPAEVGRVVGLPVRAVLPADPATAAVLSDGVPAGRGLSRRPLLRAARTAARKLHAGLTVAEPVGASSGQAARTPAGWA